MRIILVPILLASAAAAHAQIVTFGVKGGVPLSTAIFESQPLLHTNVDTGRWTAGPTVEFHITRAFSIEVDALYRSYKVTGQNLLFVISGGPPEAMPIEPPLTVAFKHDVRAWDFPLLLKYTFGDGGVRPFINGGGSYTHESADLTISCDQTCASFAAILTSYAGISKVQSNRAGAVAGGGVEFRYGKATIAPEVRYTRLFVPGGNQVGLMVGLRF